MNNDLISREALKKHITEIFEIEEKYDKKWAMGLKYSLKIIDNAPTVCGNNPKWCESCVSKGKCASTRPQCKPVIRCKDCKYQVKEWREDKRMKEKGYWVYGCNHFGEIMGYWGFGGNDNEFCSDAEQREGAE